ncbi:MAG: hypothetical protein ACE5QW_09535 [Thermoplasmata archaeon]
MCSEHSTSSTAKLEMSPFEKKCDDCAGRKKDNIIQKYCLRNGAHQVLSTPSGGRAVSEGEAPWFKNDEFNSERKNLSRVSAVWIAFCFVLGGLALLQGVLPAAMIMFMFALLMPVTLLLTSRFRNRFFVPHHVRILDDCALLLFSGGRRQRILWKEVEPPVEVRPLDDWHLNKVAENILFRTRSGRHRLLVDSRIAKSLRGSVETWHASFGRTERVFLDKRFGIDRIIAGEGSRAIGYTYVVTGALIVLLMLGSVHFLVGFSNAAFTISVFVTAVSLLVFFVFLGVAEITSRPRYVKHAFIAFFAPVTPLVAILAIDTLNRVFLALLVCLVISAIAFYPFIWRKISKSGDGDSRG